LLKIDVHTHILPPELPDLKRRYGYGGFVALEKAGPGCTRMMIDGEVFREVDQRTFEPASRLRDCDRDGVAVQVLSTVPVMFGYWAKPDHALDLAKILNDHIASVCAANPARFVGLGTLPMQDADLAIREMERCVRSLGMAGVEIGTHVNGKNLEAPEIFPVFEAAAALGAAVFVHPWDMMGRDRMGKYCLPWLVGMPAETALAICSVIFGGVIERLPTLRLCFAHGGGAFPGTFGRIDHGFHERPDLCAVNTSLSPRDTLGRFYLDSLVHDAGLLRYLVDLVGAHRVALGTDYPFPLGERVPGALIESVDTFSPEVRERLLSGSALEWLGVSKDRFVAVAR
jgi:aminocarboxymuconate-semialdehyde decarboxylase